MNYIAGNWKMNLLPEMAVELTELIKSQLVPKPNQEIVLFPQTGLIPLISQVLLDSTIQLGAQNTSDQLSGAYTGENSPELLKALRCSYCLIGHSERRQYFSESDEFIARKAEVLTSLKITPIICIGESLEEREKEIHLEKITNQIKAIYQRLEPDVWSGLVFAYEPIWAIGTGKTATADQADEIHKFIRSEIGRLGNEFVASQTSILYGGSAKPSNAKELLSREDIDGLLVGGASLNADDFLNIIESC